MWTATKTDKGRDGATVWVQATFTDGVSSFTRSYKSESVPDDWPDVEIRSQLARLNALDIDKIVLGDVTPPKPPVPPTQNELDLQAWLALKQDYQTKLKALGISKVITQTDVDDALAAMKLAYKEEYGAFL